MCSCSLHHRAHLPVNTSIKSRYTWLAQVEKKKTLKYIRSRELSAITSMSIAKPARSWMLSLLFTLAPKPRKKSHSTSAPYTHSVLMILLQVQSSKIMAFYEFPNQFLSLATVPTTFFATYPLWAPPIAGRARKSNALNLFWPFIYFVCQTAARFLPMYFTKNARHPPQPTHFLKFFPNLVEKESWIPTLAPPVIF